MLNSELDRETCKGEIKRYVQCLETNYNDKISSMQLANKKLKQEVSKQKTKGLSSVIEKKDLEQLFVDCVEDMRRTIIRRRLRAEVDARKKVGVPKAKKTIETNFGDMQSNKSFENKQVAEFEESLEKLAEMAKGRVKLNEFTT
jgi:hypothetical protein